MVRTQINSSRSAARGSQGAVSRYLSRPVLAASLTALLCFATCYFREFLLPHIPLVLWGDHLAFFYNGSRIGQGLLPYRDFFDFLPPGTDLVYALLIKIFGFRYWIPGLTMAVLAAFAAFLTTLIAARCMKGPMIALPGLLLAGFELTMSLDPTHHWFSTVAILAALLALMDGATLPRVFLAGAFCGVAACFTQSKGAAALAAFVLFLAAFPAALPAAERSARDAGRWRNCLVLVAAAAAVFAAVNGYFVWMAGLQRWLYCLVVFPLRYYSAPTINNWRVFYADIPPHHFAASWVCWPFVYATVPWALFVAVAVAWRQTKQIGNENWNRIVLIALTGFLVFLSVAASPSPKRVASLSPPALVLLTWLLAGPFERSRKAARIASTLKYLLAATAGLIVVALTAHVQVRRGPTLNLPSGRVAFADRDLYVEYRWLLENTHPGQYYFGLPPFYSAFHLVNPAAVEGIDTSAYSRPEQIAGLIDALERNRVPMLAFRQPDTYLWASGSRDDSLGPLRDYLRRNYQRTKTFATGDEIWTRVSANSAGSQ